MVTMTDPYDIAKVIRCKEIREVDVEGLDNYCGVFTMHFEDGSRLQVSTIVQQDWADGSQLELEYWPVP